MVLLLNMTKGDSSHKTYVLVPHVDLSHKLFSFVTVGQLALLSNQICVILVRVLCLFSLSILLGSFGP